MNGLVEIRNLEMMCRERALVDKDRREFWLAKADEWAQQAVDEIASQFRKSSTARSEKTTVTEIALRCGFGNLGHFAKDYREAFGHRPSEVTSSVEINANLNQLAPT